MSDIRKRFGVEFEFHEDGIHVTRVDRKAEATKGNENALRWTVRWDDKDKAFKTRPEAVKFMATDKRIEKATPKRKRAATAKKAAAPVKKALPKKTVSKAPPATPVPVPPKPPLPKKKTGAPIKPNGMTHENRVKALAEPSRDAAGEQSYSLEELLSCRAEELQQEMDVLKPKGDDHLTAKVPSGTEVQVHWVVVAYYLAHKELP